MGDSVGVQTAVSSVNLIEKCPSYVVYNFKKNCIFKTVLFGTKNISCYMHVGVLNCSTLLS